MSQTTFNQKPSKNSSLKYQAGSKSSIVTKASSMFNSCRICLSSLYDPASLTCGHRFCEDCLQEYWQAENKPDILVCPLCRGSTLNIHFSKNSNTPTSEEFRKIFQIIASIESQDNSSLICQKSNTLLSLITIILKLLKIPVDFLIFMKSRLLDMF